MLVINKKNQNNVTKLSQIYKAVDTTVINGMGVSDIGKTVDDEYEYSTMANFDYVFYTSPIKSVDDYVMETDDGYFANYDEYDPNFANELRSIYNINSSSKDDFDGLIEAPISDINKSDMR
jgi:hypothetical protein